MKRVRDSEGVVVPLQEYNTRILTVGLLVKNFTRDLFVRGPTLLFDVKPGRRTPSFVRQWPEVSNRIVSRRRRTFNVVLRQKLQRTFWHWSRNVFEVLTFEWTSLYSLIFVPTDLGDECRSSDAPSTPTVLSLPRRVRGRYRGSVSRTEGGQKYVHRVRPPSVQWFTSLERRRNVVHPG